MATVGYDYNTYKGENIAAGYTTAAQVFDAWKNSASHNENMVDPNYKVVGISLIFVSGSTYKYYWTTDFGGFIDSTARMLSSSSSSGGDSSSGGSAFVDVNRNTLYADEIELLASRGIVNGYDSGAFGPYDKVTRQQFAKMIVLALGHPVSPASACSFWDVSSTPSGTDSAYPAGYIATCAAEGITLGTTPYTFDPYDNITRAQMITMVARAAELGAPPAGYRPCFSNFSDQHYPLGGARRIRRLARRLPRNGPGLRLLGSGHARRGLPAAGRSSRQLTPQRGRARRAAGPAFASSEIVR